MKQNSRTILLVLTCIYTALFYRQNAGLNFLLFSMAFTAFAFLRQKPAARNSQWWLFCCASLFSGSILLIYPTDLAIFTNLLSLALLAVVSLNTRASLFMHILNALYSLAGTPFFMVVRLRQKWRQRKNMDVKAQTEKKAIYFLVLVLLLAFVFMYQAMNPLFGKYTRSIDLSFITVGLVLFAAGGFFLLYGCLYPHALPFLNTWERNTERAVILQHQPGTDKKRAFSLLFVALNILLVLINLSDIHYLYLGKSLPEGITHKQYVHNGVSMLICSILLGISTILYLSKCGLPGHTELRFLRVLVYGWLVQNLFMVISTSLRNTIYIEEALLTYKRIGVYYWLVLAAGGILSTLLMLRNSKPAWFLVRSNSFFAYLLLVASCAVDWDAFISSFNLSRIRDIAALDKKYLISLSESNLGQLYRIRSLPAFETDSVYHYNYNRYSSNRRLLDRKLFNFLSCYEKRTWRSFNLRSEQVFQEIQRLDRQRIFDTLDLSSSFPGSLSPLYALNNIKVLKLNYFNSLDPDFIEEVNHFSRLEVLETIISIVDSSQLKQLRHIHTLVLHNDVSRKDSALLFRLRLPYRLRLSKY